MKTEIKSISVYEQDNGFEIVATVDGEEYKVYGQLPDCPDSQHSFLDGNDEDENSEILNAIVGAADDEHSNFDFSVFCKLGHMGGYRYEKYGRYYVVVDETDIDEYFFAKESPYSDYYNTFMLADLDEGDYHDEGLMEKLHEIRKELQGDDE